MEGLHVASIVDLELTDIYFLHIQMNTSQPIFDLQRAKSIEALGWNRAGMPLPFGFTNLQCLGPKRAAVLDLFVAHVQLPLGQVHPHVDNLPGDRLAALVDVHTERPLVRNHATILWSIHWNDFFRQGFSLTVTGCFKRFRVAPAARGVPGRRRDARSEHFKHRIVKNVLCTL